jgi:hypothetical protein
MTLALCAVLVASPSWRGVAALLGGGGAIAVAYATLALAWHYPSDVLAGFLLAGLWASLAVAVLQRVEPDEGAARAALPSQRVVAFGGLGALAAVAVVAAASDGVAQHAPARTTLIAGAVTIAALALALVTTVVVAE